MRQILTQKEQRELLTTLDQARREQLLMKLSETLFEMQSQVLALVQDVKENIAQKTGPRGFQGPKGDSVKGDRGDDGKSVTLKEVVDEILPKIRIPKDGKDGLTPVKGIHYFTPKDIDQIAKKIASQMGKSTEFDPDVVLGAITSHPKGKKLLPSHIDGLEQTLHAFQTQLDNRGGYIHGGGDTVDAGTNVTITVVNGKKVISASGGGGFTTLTATETPDGSTTVFTFAAAVAQPSFIITDNVWQRATTKAGTVNWTWNAGAKQATFTVPPVDEVLGIV